MFANERPEFFKLFYAMSTLSSSFLLYLKCKHPQTLLFHVVYPLDRQRILKTFLLPFVNSCEKFY